MTISRSWAGTSVGKIRQAKNRQAQSRDHPGIVLLMQCESLRTLKRVFELSDRISKSAKLKLRHGHQLGVVADPRSPSALKVGERRGVVLEPKLTQSLERPCGFPGPQATPRSPG